MYYFGSRYYDPSIGRWLAPDPLADMYPSLSSYAYAANNPLKYIDPDGRDVILLNNEDGAYGFGHNAVVVGNDDDGWIYYSYNGDGKYSKDPYETYSDFSKSGNAKGYNRSVRFKTSKEQDASAKKQGDKEVKVKRDGSVKQILTNNCGDLVEKVAKKADIDIPNKIIPNLQYDRAKKEKKKREEKREKKQEAKKQEPREKERNL